VTSNLAVSLSGLESVSEEENVMWVVVVPAAQEVTVTVSCQLAPAVEVGVSQWKRPISSSA